MYVFSSLRIFNLLSALFRKEGLDLEGISLRERKFDLRASLSLGSNSFLVANNSLS